MQKEAIDVDSNVNRVFWINDQQQQQQQQLGLQNFKMSKINFSYWNHMLQGNCTTHKADNLSKHKTQNTKHKKQC